MYQNTLQLLRQALNEPSATFRNGQWEAIEKLINHRARLLVVQRTGWGKSIVYFLATRLLRDQGSGPTLLISPLLALMRNQILAATRIGIEAATINSSNKEVWQHVQQQLIGNAVDILLISPERLANDEFRETVLLPMANSIGLFVVDEAHCISDWGHDFRPDYRRIVRILQALPPTIPVLATTATANQRVIKDIVQQMSSTLQVIRGSLDRTSLRLQNIALPSQAERMAWLAQHIPNLPRSGIIYTLTIRDAQHLADWLQSQGIVAYPYWGGQETVEREELEEWLLNNQIKALVATSALGMGFDKPDLGFVIHFQRPGSVVHYYQQVGRAGRAVQEAYGILLSGEEDQAITNYFIETAFPPEEYTEAILDALNKAEDGLSMSEIEKYVNIPKGQIEKVLKILVTETPSPISKHKSRWYANPVAYVPDKAKIAHLKRIRYDEQKRMLEYIHTNQCLMSFLRNELDDPDLQPCGRCAVCQGKPVIAETYSSELVNKAIHFLCRSDQIIEPRKQWMGNAMDCYGWRGNIAKELLFEPGRALSIWGDAGWGELVRRGKQDDGFFDDTLVAGVVEMFRTRWKPEPQPTWVTCIPSFKHPTLVPDFAQRLADALNLPFIACVQKVRHAKPQKLMHNSYQQLQNLAGVFNIQSWEGIRGPVLLVDDIVDSRWTFTVVAALLRRAGSGPVFPLALAHIKFGAI